MQNTKIVKHEQSTEGMCSDSELMKTFLKHQAPKPEHVAKFACIGINLPNDRAQHKI